LPNWRPNTELETNSSKKFPETEYTTYRVAPRQTAFSTQHLRHTHNEST
jgi:hypothetical protein